MFNEMINSNQSFPLAKTQENASQDIGIKNSKEEAMEISKIKSIFETYKYDRQLILNLGSGGTAAGLKAKAESKGLTCEIIDLRDPNFLTNEENIQKLSQLTCASRVYIVGHNQAGTNFIYSDQEKMVTVEEYVSLLEKYAPQLINKDVEKSIKISVVSCNGANDHDEEKSFAYRLSQALDKAHISAQVIARTGFLKRWKPAMGLYKKIVDGFHKKAGSKLVFFTYKGKTSIKPFIY